MGEADGAAGLPEEKAAEVLGLGADAPGDELAEEEGATGFEVVLADEPRGAVSPARGETGLEPE